jgi:serine palmitoyltransferase
LVALKRAYKFALPVDEAYSFKALGSAGQGSLNHWKDARYDCPLSEVDIMSCMFSKSAEGTGGFVLANGIFATELRKGGEMLDARGVEALSTIVLLQILGLLRKKKLVAHRMYMLREKAAYVGREQNIAGLHVLASPGSAVICLPVGTVHKTACFHTECAKLGIAVTGVGPPATEIWSVILKISLLPDH